MVNLMCSCGKTLTAIMMGMMVDRGLLQYGEKISKYWPEFAQKGKEEVSEFITKGSHLFVLMSANS
jgi:CubicO group peptidase (beta-lactamase class C family)